MLSIEECRKFIDNSEEYTDKDIEEIRTTLYGLGELAFDVWFEDRKKEQEAKLPPKSDL